MKLLKLILSSIIVSCLASCGGGGGGGESSESSTSSSDSSTSSSVVSSIPAGTIIEINPIIEFTSELSVGSPASIKYTNTLDGLGDLTLFPISTEQTVNATLKTSASSITISFELNSGEKIELLISDFTDLEEDGLYDEFTVQAKVNSNTVMTARETFIGAFKPKSKKSRTKPFGASRAPTEEEFMDSLTLTLIHAKVDNTNLYTVLYPNGYADLFGEPSNYEEADEGDIVLQYIEWKYSYNKGQPTLLITFNYSDGSENAELYAWNFSSLYEGTFELVTSWDNGIEAEGGEGTKGNWKASYNRPDNLVRLNVN